MLPEAVSTQDAVVLQGREKPRIESPDILTTPARDYTRRPG
jgi:hypothetical protein